MMQFQKILIVGSIVCACSAILWLLLAALLQQHLPNKLPPGDDYIFDYVVVGAGTCGSVVASLLAKHSNATVLLLEAGSQFGYLSKIPLLTTFQQKGINDWSFLSVPQRYSSRGLNDQRQCLPRGKGLGGSAQLNYMLHFDGEPSDFDKWAVDYNLSAWRWAAVKPFLDAGFSKSHEMLEIEKTYSKLAAAFDEAHSEFDQKSWRFRRARYNIKNGQRWSVYQRFLQPLLKQRNLKIMTNALTRSLRLAVSQAGVKRVISVNVGIKNADDGQERRFEIHVRREIILAAGAYQTPQLLQVSGIGDTKLLQPLKLKVQHDLPRVGYNLHDHLNLPLFVSIDVVGPTLNQRALLDPISLLGYVFGGGSGHLGNFGVLGHVAAAPISSNQFGVTLFAAGAIDESALMSISNFKRAEFRALFPRYHNATQEGFVMISTCLQPRSRGTVLIGSASMRRNPLIDPNYLSIGDDVSCMIRGVRATVQLVTSHAFSALRPRIHWPRIIACENFGPFERDFQLNAPSDRYLECVLRHVGLSSHHPGGSCAMGNSTADSVVDEQLRVHGIENLRIVDASVLPTPISGNPNSILVGVAVRGATMILKKEQENQVKNND